MTPVAAPPTQRGGVVSAHRWIAYGDDDECMVCGAVAVGGCSAEMPPCCGLNAAIGEVWAAAPDGVERHQ